MNLKKSKQIIIYNGGSPRGLDGKRKAPHGLADPQSIPREIEILNL